MDARLYQITVLSCLLVYGLLRLDFEVSLLQCGLMLGAVLVTQAVGTRVAGLAKYEWRSALISGLSLCLLCRTNSMLLATLAGVLAIGTKFLVRWRGKHLFNPTNIALVVLMLVADGDVWVSPGQWGSVAFFAFLMACLGGLVVMRAGRADVALAFIITWSGLIIGRSLWLGEPLSIPLHRLQSGAILLFTFFMISDPRTTPNSRAGRLLFAGLVAYGGWWWQFRMFGTSGPLWSLAVFSLAVPLIDWCLPGKRYEWQKKHDPEPPGGDIPFIEPPASNSPTPTV
ncbi:MAG: RnfABCDGE type electron transport complex subunit D [Verrucomicrobium sp.]|nr:RnfABCDGE type electron transport complex subunit D [Verrucomicrobium sp.]